MDLCLNIDCALLQEAEIDEDLPKKLVVVEFRSLTVAEGPKAQPWRMLDISSNKNFKHFRKVRLQCRDTATYGC